MTTDLDDKEFDNKEPEDTLANKKSLPREILEIAFLEKYDSTAMLAGKLIWPALCFFLSLMFYSEMSNLIGQLSSNLSRTSKITIAGIELEIYANDIKISNFEAYSKIRELDKEELAEILKLGDSINQVDASYVTADYKERLKSLEEEGLLQINEGVTSAVDSTQTVVEIALTDQGRSVHKELQSILINFVLRLPEE